MENAKEPKELSPKHKKFADEYMQCWNAQKAYQSAYPTAKDGSAKRLGSVLLSNVNVKNYIKEKLADNQIGVDQALSILRDMVTGDKPTKTIKKKTPLGDETIQEFNNVDALDKIIRVAGGYKDNLNLNIDKITVKLIKDDDGS